MKADEMHVQWMALPVGYPMLVLGQEVIADRVSLN